MSSFLLLWLVSSTPTVPSARYILLIRRKANKLITRGNRGSLRLFVIVKKTSLSSLYSTVGLYCHSVRSCDKSLKLYNYDTSFLPFSLCIGSCLCFLIIFGHFYHGLSDCESYSSLIFLRSLLFLSKVIDTRLNLLVPSLFE